MNHDESKLPKWAQETLSQLRMRIQQLQAVEQAHAILIGREWFVIPGPPEEKAYPDDVRKLWWLNHENPFPACSLSHGDVLMVGRSRHRWGGKPVPIANGYGGQVSAAASPMNGKGV